MPNTAIAVSQRVKSAVEYAAACEYGIRESALDYLKRMLFDLSTDEDCLRTSEVVALNSILMPAHSRFLARLPCRGAETPPVLTLVPAAVKEPSA